MAAPDLATLQVRAEREEIRQAVDARGAAGPSRKKVSLMVFVECIIAWIAAGLIGLAIIDARHGKARGSSDDISWVAAMILGPIAIILAFLQDPRK